MQLHSYDFHKIPQISSTEPVTEVKIQEYHFFKPDIKMWKEIEIQFFHL